MRLPRRSPFRAAFLAALGLVAGFGCGQTLESRLTEIQALQQIGDFRSSLAPLREILAQETDHPQANFLLGLALVQTRQPTLAIWPLRKAADSKEYQINGGVLLASALLQTDGFEGAIEATDDVLELDPSNLGALLLHADASMRIGQTEEALADSETILELDLEHPRAWATKAQALFRLDRIEESEVAWQELERTLAATGDPSRAARGCLAVARFHELRESEAFEPKLQQCLDEYAGEAVLLQFASQHYLSAGRPDDSIELWQRAVEEEPDRVDLRAQLGAELSNQGRLEEAEAVLVEAAELFDDVQTWSRLSTFYQNHGQPEKALAAIERSLARGSAAPELRFRQADLLVELDRLEDAEEIAEGLDEEVYRHLLQGRLMVARGDDRGALDALEAGLTRWPNNAQARFLAGSVAEGLGLRDKAIEHYREAVRADPKATDAALRAALLEMEDGHYRSAGDFARSHINHRGFTGPEARVVAARAAIALGEFERARRGLEELRLRPGMAATERVERAALERKAQGRDAAAKVIEESELDLSDPAQEAMLRSLADDLVVLGRGEEAIARVERAVAKNPDSASYHDLLGRLLYLAGRTEEAGRHLEQALDKDPTHAPALTALARLALTEGRVDEALARTQAAIAADASSREAIYLSAQILSQQGRAHESRARLRGLLQEHPDHVGAANDLAWRLAVEGEDLDEALVLARRAARLQPVANILDTLGWVQLKRGDAASAVESFERALEVDPSAASIRYRYGLALAELDRPDEAMGALREALGTGPFPEAEAARAEVARLEGRAR